MKGALDFLKRLIIVVVIVGVAIYLLMVQVAGFDVTKYFGIGPTAGTPGEFIFEEPTETYLESYGKTIGGWICTGRDSTDRTIPFYLKPSDPCGDGEIAIACGTSVSIGEYEWEQPVTDLPPSENYYEDYIIDMYITDDKKKCVVNSKDYIKDEEQVRNVCVFCGYESVFSGVDINYSNWENSNDVQKDFSYTCPSGNLIYPVSKTADSEEKEYQDDYVSGIWRSSSTTSIITSTDYSGSTLHQRKAGGVCGPLLGKWYKSKSEGIRFFAFCPGDMHMISCLVESKNIGSTSIGNPLISVIPFIDEWHRSSCVAESGYLIVGYEAERVPTDRLIDVLCVEQLWRWSGWSTSNNNPAVFKSPTCPDGTMAISCATYPAESDTTDDYKEDIINSIWIDDDNLDGTLDTCRIAAWDRVVGVAEHKRSVGVLCANKSADIYTTGWSGWESGTTNGKTGTFTSPACNDGYNPIFCMIRTNWPNWKDGWGEDGILSIKFDDKKCNIVMGDSIGGTEFNISFNTVCAKSDKVDRLPFDLDSEPWPMEITEDPAKFNTPECSLGIATSPITASKIDEGKYQEDLLTTIMPTHQTNISFIMAYDWEGAWPWGPGNEHKRKNGVVCLNYPEAFK